MKNYRYALFLWTIVLISSCYVVKYNVKVKHIEKIKIIKRESYFDKKDTMINDLNEIEKIVKLLKKNKISFYNKIPLKFRLYIFYSNGRCDTIGLSDNIIKTDHGYYKTKVNIEDSLSIYFR